jgi:hypothetical protein
MAKLEQVTLESLSDIHCTFFTGIHAGKPYERRILVTRFVGTYRIGSGGNPDATYMVAVGNAGVEAFNPDALIIDLADLSYEWGDEMDCVFNIGESRKIPVGLVVGEKCRHAIGTLCFGVNSTTDPCEKAWIFDALDGAWNYVSGLLDEGETPEIHKAASNGNLQQVKQLLEAGVDPNRLDSSGRTPLHQASSPAIVRLLIDAGANVKATDKAQVTPLHLATHIESARLLLDAGADPDARNWDELSPLGYAKSVEIAKLLVDAGADVLLRRRESLLHVVRSPELAKFFIDSGVGVNCQDRYGKTPLDRAEENREIYKRQARDYGIAEHAVLAKQYFEIAQLLRDNGAKRSSELKS